MRDVVICAPVRSPIGEYGGSLRDRTAVQLGVDVLRGLLERTGVSGAQVDDVILGHCYPSTEAPALGRVVALDAGLPVTVPGQQLDRRCGSGLQAVVNAVMQVATGAHDVIVAGGVESMSNVVFHSTDMRWGGARRGIRVHDALVRGRTTAGGTSHPVEGGMIETAENLRRRYGISRREQDELAVESHRRAVAAQTSGIFDDEIIPVQLKNRSGVVTVDRDERPRSDTSIESLARLRPIRTQDDAEATVTAGNASGQNDAASMCLVTTRQRAEELGVEPMVRLKGWAVAGVEPALMGLGPVPSTAAVLRRLDLELADMDVIELNEAFAAQVLAIYREWNFGQSDLQRTNVHGSGISLGHPVGATGVRMLGTLARELRRRDGRYGLATVCIGGGQGIALVVEAV
ncbi:acetyl-CoA C-acetyltransferase [Sinosporangium album]|uniref:Probable acetyl-CoA acetyltransferase n=1 Tax=Sinosporangium album TaxID=504805 RepID=A0A1G8FQW7_9ACTN|nr:acetyl-CoA C-acetyltransferase [Sinosporangium album]SDH84477.1 acetyl-CoA C-acetyltransferase [Sinosporangium album]